MLCDDHCLNLEFLYVFNFIFTKIYFIFLLYDYLLNQNICFISFSFLLHFNISKNNSLIYSLKGEVNYCQLFCE